MLKHHFTQRAERLDHLRRFRTLPHAAQKRLRSMVLNARSESAAPLNPVRLRNIARSEARFARSPMPSSLDAMPCGYQDAAFHAREDAAHSAAHLYQLARRFQHGARALDRCYI